MPSTRLTKFAAGAAAALILLGAGIVLFHNLGLAPFQDYDEATYAEIVDESLAHGNFASLTFLNQPYFRKPPLMFWMADVTRSTLSDAELALRLPTALAALLTIGLVMLVVIEAGTTWWAALIAGFVLATTSSFMESARSARFDTLVSLFIIAALYAGMRALRAESEAHEEGGIVEGRTRAVWWYALMGALVGGAVLSKSVIAIFAPIALLAYFIYTKNLSALRRPAFWVSIIAFIIIAAPWHIYETIKFGGAFWHSYLGEQVLDRAHENLFVGTNAPTNIGYVGYFLRFSAPWSELLLFVLLLSPLFIRRMSLRASATYRAALVALLSVLAVDLISKTKAVSYLIPLYPFMAIIIALGAEALWQRVSERAGLRERIQGALLGIGLFCGIVALCLCVYNAWHINPYFSWVSNEAHDEQAVAQAIDARTDDPIIYTYKNDDLGTVEYYTRLPFKPSRFVYPFENATSTSANSFVLTQDPAALRAAFPNYSFTSIYAGSVLSAFEVTSSS